MKKLILIGGIIQTIFSAIGLIITSLFWFLIATCAAAVSGIASGISGGEGSGEVNLGLFGVLCPIAVLLMFLLFVSGIVSAVMVSKGKVIVPFYIVQMVFESLVSAFFVYLLILTGNSTGIAGGIALAAMFMVPFVLYLSGLIAHFKASKEEELEE